MDIAFAAVCFVLLLTVLVLAMVRAARGCPLPPRPRRRPGYYDVLPNGHANACDCTHCDDQYGPAS